MKLGWKLLIVVVLLGSFGSLYLIGNRTTGNVVWEPSPLVDMENCTESAVQGLWSDTLMGDPGLVVVHNSSLAGGCAAFGILDNGAEDIKIIYYQYENETFDPFSGRYYETEVVGAYHLNVTTDLYALVDFSTYLSTATNLLLLVGTDDGWNNRTLVDANDAKTEYEKHFIAGINLPVPDIIGVDPVYLHGEIEGPSTDNLTMYNVTILENKTFEFLIFERRTPILSPPAFTQDISNYTFEMNSDWNEAFAIADHFGMEEGTLVGVSNEGYNNTDGEWINHSIINGYLNFKPATNFTGERFFLLSGMGPYGTTDSNYFSVMIVEDLNESPEFQGTIIDFILNMTTNVTIYLEDFFADPDGDTLAYSLQNVTNVSYSVDYSVEEMYIWLEPGFHSFEKFRIVASDGNLTARSNEITIFLDNTSVQGPDLNGSLFDLENDSGIVTPGNLSAPGAGETEGEGGGISKSLWIVIIAAIFILLAAAAGAMIYFKYFDKGPIKPVGPNTSVNDYLSKIKDGGKPEGPATVKVPVASGTVPPVNSANPVAKAPETAAGVPVQKSAVDEYLKKINSSGTDPSNY